MSLSKVFKTLPLLAIAVTILTGCNGSGGTDFVSQCHLTQEYKNEAGKSYNFIEEGIGEVTLKRTVDGDTAHFTNSDGLIAKARFLGNDTPESTGKIEPWGKGASKFTSEKLTNAKHIVLQDKYVYGGHAHQATECDSNGRQLSLVWVTEVENPTLNDFKLINLWLVQEGWSAAKSVEGLEYADAFRDADLQAQKQKLHIWSDEKDPDYYEGEEVLTTIKDLYDRKDDLLGMKVRIEGTISRSVGSYDSYIQDGDYGIYLFAFYRTITPIRTAGNRVKVTGILAEFAGSLQLTDIVYSEFFPTSNDPEIISRGNVITPRTLTCHELAAGKYIGTLVTVKGVKATYGYGGKDEIDKSTGKPYQNNALTAYIEDTSTQKGDETGIRVPQDVSIYETSTSTTPVRSYKYFWDNTDPDNPIEHTFDAVGIVAKYETQSGKLRYQITICNRDDLTRLS